MINDFIKPSPLQKLGEQDICGDCFWRPLSPNFFLLKTLLSYEEPNQQ